MLISETLRRHLPGLLRLPLANIEGRIQGRITIKMYFYIINLSVIKLITNVMLILQASKDIRNRNVLLRAPSEHFAVWSESRSSA
jgi:hypothetical protein